MKKYFFTSILLFLIPLCLFVFSACGGGKGDESLNKKVDKMIDSSNVAIGVSGKVFIIPSPIQTAMLIKKSGAPYSKAIMNGTDKVNSYSTTFLKCLNLA